MAESRAERGRGVGARAAEGVPRRHGLGSAERQRLASAVAIWVRRPVWLRIAPTDGPAMAGRFQAWPVNGVPVPSPAPFDADRELTELTLSPPGERARTIAGGVANMVKVSMDGAPFLRKVEVPADGDYYKLAQDLNALFGCFSIGIANGLKDGHVVAYEDVDGDWLLAGDVPWRMFVRSCKRIRVMPASEAMGPSANA